MGTSSDLKELLRVYWSLLLGNTVEWYDFAIYGFLEVYIEKHFFHGSALGAWLGFSVTFIARPLGGILFGTLGDIWGRRAAVNISIIGMLVGTAGQGLLPTFADGEIWGHFGLVCLIVLRFVQGLSAAGEIGTISTYITEVGSHRSIGRSMSLVSITCNVGFLVAKAVEWLVATAVGPVHMARWGWRVPFVFATLPGLISVWGRKYLPESETFLQERSQQIRVRKAAEPNVEANVVDEAASQEGSTPQDAPVPTESRSTVLQASAIVVGTLRSHWANVLMGIGGVASFAILQYGGLVWMNSYLLKHGLGKDATMLAGVLCRAVMIVLALPTGWLTDVMGIGCVTFISGCAIALGGLPLFAIVAAHAADATSVVLAYGLGFAVLGSLGGSVFFLFVVELFPTAVRSTAVCISYNIGFSVFGGLAPIIAQESLSVSPLGPGYMMSAGGLITATTVLVGVLLQRKGHMQLAYVRQEPYFSTGCRTRREARAGSGACIVPKSEEQAMKPIAGGVAEPHSKEVQIDHPALC